MVMSFGRKGKLSSRYVETYDILQHVGKVVYELPTELPFVHPVFHVSILKKCLGNPLLILSVKGLVVDENL